MTTRCNKISPETLTAFHERALPWWQALALKSHTRRCTSCQAQLAHCIALDTQLRTLAPIPAEITPFFLQKHRGLLVGSSFALAALSLGAWRFFTPELTWADVEKAMSEVETTQWTRTVVSYPPTQKPGIQTTIFENLVRLTDPALSQALTPKRFDYPYAYQRNPKWHQGDWSEPYFDGSPRAQIDDMDVTQHDWTFLHPLLPDTQKGSFTRPSVQILQGKRFISFSRETSSYSLGTQRIAERETIIVDPSTKLIFSRQRYFVNLSAGDRFSESSHDIFYNKPKITKYNNPKIDINDFIKNFIKTNPRFSNSPPGSFQWTFIRCVPANTKESPQAMDVSYQLIFKKYDPKTKNEILTKIPFRLRVFPDGQIRQISPTPSPALRPSPTRR